MTFFCGDSGALWKHLPGHGEGAVVVARLLQLVHAGNPLLPGRTGMKPSVRC